jgi:hypothetical protein
MFSPSPGSVLTGLKCPLFLSGASLLGGRGASWRSFAGCGAGEAQELCFVTSGIPQALLVYWLAFDRL